MRKGNYSIVFIILAAVIVSMAFLPGCTGAKYRQVTVTNSKVAYSFEYPAYYTDPHGTLDGKMGSADGPFVSLRFTNPDDVNSIIENGFTVDTAVYGTGSYYYDAQMKAADLVLDIETRIPELEGRILEHIETTVVGVPAEYIVYTAKRISAGGQTLPSSTYFIDVFFDYNGHVWHIGVYAQPDIADRVKEEFNQIIKSFKFIN